MIDFMSAEVAGVTYWAFVFSPDIAMAFLSYLFSGLGWFMALNLTVFFGSMASSQWRALNKPYRECSYNPNHNLIGNAKWYEGLFALAVISLVASGVAIYYSIKGLFK